MSLASETRSGAKHIGNSYEAIAEMGGELPEHKNLENMPSSIDSISVIEEGDGTLWGTAYTSSSPNGIALLDRAEYLSLCNSGPSTNVVIGGSSISRSSITKFSFGSACTFAPNYFMNGSENLTQLSHTEVLKAIGNYFCKELPISHNLDFPNVVEVGDYFLMGETRVIEGGFNSKINFSAKLKSIGQGFLIWQRSYNQPITFLPYLSEIPSSFLSNCTSFNQRIIIPANIKRIGNSVNFGGDAFAQNLIIPETVEEIGYSFLASMKMFTGLLTIETPTIPAQPNICVSAADKYVSSYTDGIRINGTYAAAWKEAMPNNTSDNGQPRILILVENA